MKFLKDYFLLILMLVGTVTVIVLSLQFPPLPEGDQQAGFADAPAMVANEPVALPPAIEGKKVEDLNQPQSLAKQELIIAKPDGDVVKLSAEVAKSMRETTIGMMFRDSVPEKTGMIFLFDELQEHTFWMKNTFIPLDILFIGADMKIISIHKSAKPMSMDPIPSNGEVFAVLEIGGGQADILGISVGDVVRSADMEGFYQIALRNKEQEEAEEAAVENVVQPVENPVVQDGGAQVKSENPEKIQ